MKKLLLTLLMIGAMSCAASVSQAGDCANETCRTKVRSVVTFPVRVVRHHRHKVVQKKKCRQLRRCRRCGK